jgi:hypothetical protein
VTSRSGHTPASLSLKLKRINDIVNEVNLIKSIKFERLVKEAYHLGQQKSGRSKAHQSLGNEKSRILSKSKEQKEMKRLFSEYKNTLISS